MANQGVIKLLQQLFEAKFGDSTTEQLNALASTGDGFILAGHRLHAGPSNDAWLVRADLAGNMLWFKELPAAGNADDYAIGVTADASGYTLAGTQFTGGSNGDYRLIRTDLDGQSHF